MRSPRHLVVTLGVVGVVVITVGLIVPKLTGSNAPQGAASPGGGSTSTAPGQPGATGGGTSAPGPGGGGQQTAAAPTTSLPNRLTSLPQTPTPAPPAQKALETVTLWAKAWVTHPQGVTTEQWLNTLRPYTTEEQIAIMSTVDPANIAATEVTGEPKATANSYTTSVEATLPTNGGTLWITVIATPLGWKVARYEQAA